MRKNLFFVFALMLQFGAEAQSQYSDSLKKDFQIEAHDSSKIFTLCKLSDYYSFIYPDSALYYAEKIISLSKELKFQYGEALGLLCKGQAFDKVANFPSALEMAFNSLDIAKNLDEHRFYMLSKIYKFIAHLNTMTENFKDAIVFYRQSIDFTNQYVESDDDVYFNYFGLAFIMLGLNQTDSALFYIEKGKKFLPILENISRHPNPWLITGNIYNAIGKIDSAEKYYRWGLNISEKYNNLFLCAVLYNALGDIFMQKKKVDSAVYYRYQSLLLSRKYKYRVFAMEASNGLAEIYDNKNSDSTLKYIKIMLEEKNQIYDETKLNQFQQLKNEDEKRQRDLGNAKARFHEQIRMYGLIAALSFFLIIAIIFWRNNKQKQNANALLQNQKDKVEQTLIELKATQSQLIQSEKMASLGELTAGIAHEIQNPLNFVNNFSDVNKELLQELNDEADKGNMDEVKAIASDIIGNEQKINHHGKRADAIIKGMLQHSRSSTGVKEPTDINALSDEFLRLAYHGVRAKDSSFNVTTKTDFDESVGKINIIPQDIGRALLNLYNNAFYAVAEKKKASSVSYEPTVSVSTKKNDNKVFIIVRDNGNGIPQKVVDKIFQPFFTTKPTGQGTGLGLSLSYDIVKAHGGEIKVETKEDEFTEFIIQLPSTI